MFRVSVLFYFLILFERSYSQLAISLAECEDAFIKNNLLLIAEQFNVDASKATIIQAKIWQQPYVSGELNMANPQNKKAFDIGKNGQMAFAIQQLIYLGGKKKNEIALARLNSEVAELEFEKLLVNLKYELHQNFYTLYFENQKASTILTQIAILDTLINAYSVQVGKGNLPLKDQVRLMSLSMSFKNDLLSIQKTINEANQQLQLLTSLNERLTPTTSTEQLKAFLEKPIEKNIEELVQNALSKNQQLKQSSKEVESYERNLKLQKSLAIPDLTLGANYDQRGGAFQNQVNLTFGVPLPLWNVNKGNIKIAQAEINQSKITKDYTQISIQKKVESAYSTWLQHREQLKSVTVQSTENLRLVYDGVLSNFLKRNISLLEFTDFMESYNQSFIDLNEMKKQMALSCEELNYLTNETLF